jgi:glycogen debranching enzyme
MFERDMAYHQGTTWVFPMGGYYLAWLKVHGYAPEAVAQVREQLRALEPMLRQGCIDQLPEIYDGDFPSEGKGCFAQAWSVGEMLRVFEAIEQK